MTELHARPRPWVRRVLDRSAFDAVVVFAVALAVRLTYLLTSNGGLGGNFGYDAGVYYTASASLLHGNFPYADYTLLHPPGLVLALTPFATIGRLTTDHFGFELASVAFIALAAVNATLVSAIARRCGLSRAAALLGGLFYAVWFGAVDAEISARLEPLGSFVFLGGLLLAVPGARSGPRRTIVGGALIGVAIAVKVWWIVPALVVLVWLILQRTDRRRLGRFCAGMITGPAVVAGPFFLAAPGDMWRMLISDQLGRPGGGRTGVERMDILSSFAPAHVFTGLPAVVPVVLAAGLAVVLSWRAWAEPVGRLVVGLFWVQLAVLAVAPTYFYFYSGYLAPSAALLVAFAARRAPARFGVSAARTATVVAAALSVSAIAVGALNVSSPFPGAQLAGGVRHVHCLMADSPMALIQLDALTRDLDHDCPNWVDVTGRTYDVDAPPDGSFVRRHENHRWQADILRYLRSGDAAVVIRSTSGLSRTTRRTIASWPVLADVDGVTVHRPR